MPFSQAASGLIQLQVPEPRAALLLALAAAARLAVRRRTS